MPAASPASSTAPFSLPHRGFVALIVLAGSVFGCYSVFTEGGVASIYAAIAEGMPLGEGLLFADPTLYLMMGLALVSELVHLPLPKGGRMTAGFLIAFATLLMLGLPGAIVVTAFASWAVECFPGKSGAGHRLYNALFNASQYALAYGAAYAALSWNHNYIPGFPGQDDFANVALATLTYLAVNFLIVDTGIALRTGMPIWRIVWEDDRPEILVTLALAPMALLMAMMYAAQRWWGLSIVMIPLLATAYFVRLFIKVKRTGQELTETNAQLTILQEVASRIGSQIELEQTLTLISQEIRRVVAYHDCMIFLHDAGSERLVRQLTSDPFLPRVPLQVPVAHGVIGEAVRSKTAILKSDLMADALDVGALSGYRSLLAVPIQTESEALGVLALLHRDPAAFDAGDERLLKILSAQAAVAIQNAQLYRATQQLAVTDGLTKVYNRRYFEEQLAAELERARRQNHQTSLILLDVDHFKQFNDTHGHLLGDQVLQGVARVLQKSTRETDLVARYGGEEFAVILPETPPDAALEVAERIRRAIKGHPFWGRAQTPLTVTASLGLASDPESLLAPKPLIDQADTSLYQAKRQGRDRVCQTIYRPDQPLTVTESRKEEAPEQTLRRPVRRAVAALSIADWERYLQGHVHSTFERFWEDQRVRDVLADNRTFWFETFERFVGHLIKELGSTEEERNAWIEQFANHPLYRPLQHELSELIASGVSATQVEYATLSFYRQIQSLVEGAPFSLEERLLVGSVQERLFHVFQLMVASVWHDFYQATSEQLALVAELESRLTASFAEEAVYEEIARLAAQAMRAEACLVLTEDGAGALRVQAAAGLGPLDSDFRIPLRESMVGRVFTSGAVEVVPALEADGRLFRPFFECLREAAPLRSSLAIPLWRDGQALGVLLCLSAELDHFTPLDERLGRDVGARLAQALMRQRREAERQSRYLDAIQALVEALEQRAEAAGGLRQDARLEAYADALAADLAVPELERAALRQAVRLHDIGELAVPDHLLAQTSPLEPEQRATIETHPVQGARILGYVDALRDVVPIVRHHHERLDGSGYPDRLKGDAIPLLARVLAVADAFHAMTSDRPYRRAMSADQAFYELRRSQQYDPNLVDRLERLWQAGTLPGAN